MAGSVYSVSQVTDYIQAMFSQDYLLGRVSVRGEISNCKYHTSGHIYFTLKDEGASMSCILFASSRRNLRFRLSEGMRVVATGRVGVYKQGGSYSLYVADVTADGIGALYERYEALKKELEEMGMFDAAYKQPIPKYIRTLGVVTAPTGAAVRDIIQIAKRRNPGISILLYPAKVQGEGAAMSIARGIRMLEEAGVDVIIAGRGGGSIEDLWAFNEEITAKAFFACSVPIISAVGHETDTVITDFVADLRAPTPSAASELAVADMYTLVNALREKRQLLGTRMDAHLRGGKDRLEQRRRVLEMFSPQQRLSNQRQQLMDKEDRLTFLMRQHLERVRRTLEVKKEQLQGLSPQHMLAMGAALIRGSDGLLRRSAAQLQEGEEVRLFMEDGTADARILTVNHGENHGDRSGGSGI